MGEKPTYRELEERVLALENRLADLEKPETGLSDGDKLYRRIIDTTSEGFLLLDENRFVQDVNASFLEMSGLAADEVTGKPFDGIYSQEKVQFYFADRDHLSFETRLRNSSGTPVLITRSALRNGDGEIDHYICFLTNLTEQKHVHEKLRIAESRYRSMYENAVQGMFQTTLSGRILRVNPAYAEMLGFDSPEALLARHRRTLRFYDDPEHRKEMLEVLVKQGYVVDYELKHRRRDDSILWTLANIRLIESDHHEPVLEGILVDNTERKAAQDKLRRSRESFRNLAIRDNLTGLFNTRHLYAELRKMIGNSRSRKQNTVFSLIFMDMDNFKNVVDTYGHLSGSQALKEVADTIRSCLSEAAFGVAYGGDEFVVVLPGLDKQQALRTAEIIRAKMHDTVYLTDRGHRVTLRASFGVATFPVDADSLDELLSLADQAMFRIKEIGKDAVGTG